MNSPTETVIPLMIAGPSRKPPLRSISAETMAMTGRRQRLFDEDIFSKVYTTPLLCVHFALYGATPFYYLLHYSPFRDRGDGWGAGVLHQLVRLILFLVTMYVTAVIVVLWSGKYQVRKNMTALSLVIVGVVVSGCLKSRNDGTEVSVR